MKIHRLMALAAVTSCATWSAGAQANVLVFTDLSSFLAAAPGATNLPIPSPSSGASSENVGSPYGLGPVTFSVENTMPDPEAASLGVPNDGVTLYQDGAYSDDGGTSIPYVGSYGTSQTMSSSGNQLGLQLGLFGGVSDIAASVSAKTLFEPIYNISYVVNGQYGSIYLPYSPNTAFLGFVSDSGPVSVSFTSMSEIPVFDFEAETPSASLPYELDTTAVYVNGSAVPEPASWAMMICGIGLAGGTMRRRRGGIARPSFS